MRRPNAHVIDARAKNLFRASFPPDWIVREVPEDFGISLIKSSGPPVLPIGNELLSSSRTRFPRDLPAKIIKSFHDIYPLCFTNSFKII